jgi:hypothetical protein
VILPDVNVLVYAYRVDAPKHERYRRWLEGVLDGREAYGLADLVLAGFLRVVTHPRVFSPPSPTAHALGFAAALRGHPNCVSVGPGPRHWSILLDLCRTAAVKGNLVPDAYLAALAIESGSEWMTTDRDYSRFPGLRWRDPGAEGGP